MPFDRHLSMLTVSQYPIPQVMSSRKSSSRVQKRQADSPLSDAAGGTKITKTTTRTTTSAYSRNFQQHMIEYGVYDYRYTYPNGQRTPKPNNLNEIMERLIRPRRSLSPSRFTETDYREVEQADADADNETPVTTGVIPLIEGKYAHMNCRGQDLLHVRDSARRTSRRQELGGSNGDAVLHGSSPSR